MTWREDRETLRKYIQEHKPTGEVATVLYVLVSHMRGKIHMKYCNSYAAFKNRTYKTTSELPAPTAKLRRSYSFDTIDYYHKQIYIGSLEDQANWFSCAGKEFLKYLPENIAKISDRVFSGYPEEKINLPEVATHV